MKNSHTSSSVSINEPRKERLEPVTNSSNLSFSSEEIDLISEYNLSIDDISSSLSEVGNNVSIEAEAQQKEAEATEKKATEEADAKQKLEEAAKQKAAEASNSRMKGQILNGLAILLHVLEIAGLVGVFIILKKYNDRVERRKYEIEQLKGKIIALEEKKQTQNNTPISNHSSSIPTHLASRLDRMESQISSLQNNLSTNSTQQQGYLSQPSRSLPPAPPAMKSSGYAFLDLYKQNFAFDWEEPGNLNYQTTFSLLEPALVSILPTENLTWKLIQRGILSSFLNPDAQRQNQAVNGESFPNIEQMVEQAVKVRLSILEKQLSDRLTAQMKVEIQEFQAGSIDKNKYDYTFSNNTNSTPAPEPESLGDLWRQSLTDMMIFGDDNVPEVETSDKSTVQNIEIETNPQSFDRSMPLQEQIIDGEFVQPVPNSNDTKFNFKNIQLSPLAKMYNSGAKNFLRSYMVIEASIMRKDIDSSMVELVEDRVGIYWIIPFDKSKYYLVPKIDFPNEDKYLQGLVNLFDGDNNQSNFGLFKPAIIDITKASMPKQWKLESKGILGTV